MLESSFALIYLEIFNCITGDLKNINIEATQQQFRMFQPSIKPRQEISTAQSIIQPFIQPLFQPVIKESTFNQVNQRQNIEG